MLLIPNTNRAIVGVKDGKLYLLNRDNMGGYNGSADNVIQTINVGANAYQRSSIIVLQRHAKRIRVFLGENSLLRAFHYSRTTNMFNLDSTISSGLQGPTGNNGQCSLFLQTVQQTPLRSCGQVMLPMEMPTNL